MPVAAHVFTGDALGDCTQCPLPSGHPLHLPPAAAPQHEPGKRPINVHTKDEGMALAATSQASEEFRTTFFLAMAEVATRQHFLTTNDAWDLLESRGYSRSGSAQAVGTVGPSGCSIGLWKRTDQKALNTSGNLHSADDGVRVYASLIVGKDFADVADAVRTKAAALAEKAAERAARAAGAPVAPTVPEGSTEVVEYRLIDPDGVTSPLLAAHVEEARKTLPDWTVQRQTVIRTPWETM